MKKKPKIRNKYCAEGNRCEKETINVYDAIVIKPFGKEELKIAVSHGKPISVLNSMVSGDVDFSKMSNIVRQDLLLNNPDKEEELSSEIIEEGSE